jgi:hypothetical protein
VAIFVTFTHGETAVTVYKKVLDEAAFAVV